MDLVLGSGSLGDLQPSAVQGVRVMREMHFTHLTHEVQVREAVCARVHRAEGDIVPWRDVAIVVEVVEVGLAAVLHRLHIDGTQVEGEGLKIHTSVSEQVAKCL